MLTRPIHEAIDRITVFTHMCFLRKMVLQSLFDDIAYSADIFGDDIYEKHSALVGADYTFIRHENIKYHVQLFATKDVVDLHPSMHEPMDQLSELVHRTVQTIGLVNNYLAAAFAKSPVYADIKALLPPFVATVFDEGVIKHDSPIVYPCWRTVTKYTDAEIAEFNRLHAATLKQFKILQLNQLTL